MNNLSAAGKAFILSYLILGFLFGYSLLTEQYMYTILIFGLWFITKELDHYYLFVPYLVFCLRQTLTHLYLNVGELPGEKVPYEIAWLPQKELLAYAKKLRSNEQFWENYRDFMADEEMIENHITKACLGNATVDDYPPKMISFFRQKISTYLSFI